MFNIEKDEKYYSIIEDILKNDEFKRLNNIEHHGITRYEHSVKVSYVSYKICKLLNLDYIDAARAGLLHDFFMSKEDRTFKEKFISTFVHPKIAVDNSIRVFGVNGREYDIIRSHMFPFTTSIPKYAESWAVIFADKTIGSFEFLKKFSYQFNYATNLFIIFILNYLK